MNKHKDQNIDEARRLLKAAGFEWESFNNGLHWRIAGLDFYPSTHKWMDTRNDFKGDGVPEFIKYIKQPKHKPEPGFKPMTVEQFFEVAKHSKDKSLFGICEAIHKEVYK